MKTPPRTMFAAYLWALVFFLVLDAAWLLVMGPRLYQPALGSLMAPTVNWVAALLFYPIYLAGLLVFAIAPAVSERRPGVALRRGALLGFVAYATYDLTNQATLRDWPWIVTAADLVWGTVVSGISSWAASGLTSRPGRQKTAQ